MECRASAALSPVLIETVVRGNSQLSAGSTAVSLGGAIARGLAISRIKRSLFALVLLALGAGGAGLVASQFGPSSAIEADPTGRRTPSALSVTSTSMVTRFQKVPWLA